MRDRDRTSRGNLLLEKRHHRSVGAQHIAEAHRYKFGLIFLVAVLHNHFANPLGGAHHIGWVYRLVCGN